MNQFVLGLATAMLFGACTDSSITVDNESDFVITDIYLTSTSSSDFGPNLIEGDQLNPGETLKINVSCGTYDAMIVDETGVTCNLDAIDLCADNATWVIGNDTCAAFRKAADLKLKTLAPTATHADQSRE